jgi:hypothetical protein
MPMKRFQAFEFEDASWFPALVRDLMTDYLGAAVEMLRLFAPAADVIAAGLAGSGEHRIVDLGSGGGRVWLSLAPVLESQVPGLQVRLTDAYPNAAALNAVVAKLPGILAAEARSVDARKVPGDLPGLRTMFLAFHHFPPDDAQKILEDGVAGGQAVVIFEGQRRDLGHLLQFAISPLAVLLMTPAIRPFRLSRILFTYLIPIVPLLVGWDGVVSVLRTYTEDEMRLLASKADPEAHFTWETGELASGTSVVPYLLGVPTAPK